MQIVGHLLEAATLRKRRSNDEVRPLPPDRLTVSRELLARAHGRPDHPGCHLADLDQLTNVIDALITMAATPYSLIPER